MGYFAGLDIGLERTAICVVDAEVRRVAEAQVSTEPEPLIAWLRVHDEPYELIVMGAGPGACPVSV